MGQIYVPATASAANGIMTLNTSIIIGGGTPGGGAWLYWTPQGFTGTGWYWDDSDNYLQQGWNNLIASTSGNLPDCDTIHDNTYSSFLQHVQYDNAVNLNNILGGWSSRDKYAFIMAHEENLTDNGCVVWD